MDVAQAKESNTEKDMGREHAGEQRNAARRRRRWIKRALMVVGVALVVAIAVVTFLPDPVSVDTTAVRRGPIATRLAESGKTRLRNRYVVRAPISGNMTRLDVWPGDIVETERVLTRLTATVSPLMTVQQKRGAQARVAAADAGLKAAKGEAKRAELAASKLGADVARVKILVASGASPTGRLTDLEHAHRDAEQVAATSEFRILVARGELRAARAVLSAHGVGDARGAAIELRAPAGGTILRVLRRDAGPVATGEPLLEVGDMASLEVVIDVLTVDALDLSLGAEVRLNGSRDDLQVSAHVTRIEPSGFTRLSALGVEEQRVNVIARFDSPPPAGLGAGFGVETEIMVRAESETLVVDSGSLFRSGPGWAAYRITDGHAELTPVRVGIRSDFEAQILGGLTAEDVVVLHPSDQVSDGTRVERR